MPETADQRARAIPRAVLDGILDQLKAGRPVRRRLPGGGLVHIDRPLPFLCVYRQPQAAADAGTDRLLRGGAAYMIVTGSSAQRRQLEALLAEHHFLPSAFQPALFAPPVSRRVIMRSAPAWERVGMSLWPGFSGVLIIEAIKQVRAVSGERVRNGAFAPLKPAAAANPAMLGSGLNECMDASSE